MATFTWTTGGGGNWGTGSSWNPTAGAPPGGSTSDIDTAVLSNLASGGNYTVTVATGLLHDTVEDTVATLEELERNFGPEIASLVALSLIAPEPRKAGGGA